MTELTLHSDGGSRFNPGPAALGFVIQDGTGQILQEEAKFLGVKTNNEAEYLGLIEGLKAARQYQPSKIDCFLDSALIVCQLNGTYRVKHPKMVELYKVVKDLESSFPSISYTHIPREQNRRADALLNEALDQNLN